MYYIEFNNKKSTYFTGLSVITRPVIPIPQRRYEEIDVEGRDGIDYRNIGTIDDINITVNFNLRSTQESIHKILTEIKHWLFSNSGINELILSDNKEYFYKVKKVTMTDVSRTTKRIYAFSVTFCCEGYTYDYNSCHNAIDCGVETTVNIPPLVTEAKPEYIITCDDICELIVNGKQCRTNPIDGKIRIDTKNELCYKSDGNIDNSMLSGEYDNLYLFSGQNTVSVVPNIVDNTKMSIGLLQSQTVGNKNITTLNTSNVNYITTELIEIPMCMRGKTIYFYNYIGNSDNLTYVRVATLNNDREKTILQNYLSSGVYRLTIDSSAEYIRISFPVTENAKYEATTYNRTSHKLNGYPGYVPNLSMLRNERYF